MATKSKPRKRNGQFAKGGSRKAAKRPRAKARKAVAANYTVVASKPARRKGRSRVRTVVKTVVRRARAKTVAVYRRAKSSASGGMRVISSNKKETVINIAALGAGFVGTMAIVNMAPIPSSFKPKWKGAAIAALAIIGALKVRDRRFQLGLAGAAVYGVIDLARNYIPGLAALGAYDNSAVILGAPESRARKAIGNAHSRAATAVGGSSAAPRRPMVVGGVRSSSYTSSAS